MGSKDDEQTGNDEAREEMRELEGRDDLPSDPREWPSGKSKTMTFGSESDEPYGEGPTAKLGPPSVEHHSDGTVSVGGKQVDNPEDFKGEPIPGGPTDPSSPDIAGEQSRRGAEPVEE